ncbi:hypothetical protein ABRZ58_15360 [Vibrio vulnificus]|uniref:hypothetical protein n=1 Tax=Vibrio vulnificus TaxID=672 RepID=UPI001CCF90DF|nr:hypothetical protein [Vibrio vulnificus]
MLVTMSDKDLSRYKVINDVCEHRLRESGAASLVHGARGKPSSNRISSDYRQIILALVRKHYSDFSPTLAREKLIEIHNLPISNETLRQWMATQKPSIRYEARLFRGVRLDMP